LLKRSSMRRARIISLIFRRQARSGDRSRFLAVCIVIVLAPCFFSPASRSTQAARRMAT
jgi:hypothetical protein